MFFQLEEVTLEFKVTHKQRYTPKNVARTKADLDDPTKWSLGDANVFGELLRSLEKDVLDIYRFKEVMSHSVSQIESQLLKGKNHTLFREANITTLFIILCSGNKKGRDLEIREG